MSKSHERSYFSFLSVLIFILNILSSGASAQDILKINYDESKAGTYTLPDPLIFMNGEKVKSAKDWLKRREEIIKLYNENIYGISPATPKNMTYKVVEEDRKALNGKAVRKQVEIYPLGREDGPKFNMLIYLPAKVKKPAPLFLGLSFSPVHEVYPDKKIIIHDEWDRRKTKRKFTPTEDSRGTAKGWEINKCLDSGYGVAIIYYCDIEPDFMGGSKYGLKPYFYKEGQTESSANEWGVISEWAWGLSRGMDYLEKDKDVDSKSVVIVGHSRLGKTVLWAGAQDIRFAAVVSSCSGEMGAALARRDFGETVDTIAAKFPYWFCENFQRYKKHWNDLPVDSHMLISLIAPRPVFISTGSEDPWSDPKGQFLAAAAAGAVYRLLGKEDLGQNQMPPLDTPIYHTLGFQIHKGIHAVLAEDWDKFLKFADKFVKNKN